LTLKDFDPNSAADRAELQHSHNVVHCKLYSATNNSRDVSTITDPTDPNKLIRSLMGMASSTPFVGTDPSSPATLPEEQRIGVYYIFHDISCRHTGRYRLYFELASLSMDVGITRNVVASALSEVFEVYSAKDFPGMRPSSDLTRELKRQGANLPIKKGVEAKGSRRNRKAGRDDSDDSSGDGR
jgi:Velvet factor